MGGLMGAMIICCAIICSVAYAGMFIITIAAIYGIFKMSVDAKAQYEYIATTAVTLILVIITAYPVWSICCSAINLVLEGE